MLLLNNKEWHAERGNCTSCIILWKLCGQVGGGCCPNRQWVSPVNVVAWHIACACTLQVYQSHHVWVRSSGLAPASAVCISSTLLGNKEWPVLGGGVVD